MQAKTVTRKELYRQVWSQPISRLARAYGFSDVGLAKICRKHDIPRPPVGYWAKKEFGKAPAQTPLPDPDNDYPIELRDPAASTVFMPDPAPADAAGAAKKKEPRIEVAETLRGCHGLVSQANQELQGAQTDEYGLVVLGEQPTLHVRVSKASLRRALLIADALLKALEQRGHRVGRGPAVEIQGVGLRFTITERLQSQRHQPEEHDLDGPYHFGHSRFDVKRVPSGRLVLEIGRPAGYWSLGCRHTWRDTEKHTLEGCLNRIVAGLVQTAARVKVEQEKQQRRAQERRAEEARRQEEERRRAEARARVEAERARVAELRQQVKDWRESQELRAYVEAARQKHLADRGSIEPDSDFGRWLEWATRQADRLDPLRESPPSILDEAVDDGASHDHPHRRTG